MYNDLSHYLLTISIFSAFIIKSSSITQRWILSFYFIISSLSFYAALVGYIDSDFSVYNIFTNSNVNTPLFYKISSTWSNHEGSLLLWCWFLTLYGFVFCYSITIFESNRKNGELFFLHTELLSSLNSNTALKNSIDKKDILTAVDGKHHAILFINQSQKQPVLFVPVAAVKSCLEHKKGKSDQSFSFTKQREEDNHLQNINGQIKAESTTEIQHKHRDRSLAYLKHTHSSSSFCSAVSFCRKKHTAVCFLKETVLFPSTLYFQALLKNPLESLIQEKQLYPQKYTEIDHLVSFKRFKPFFCSSKLFYGNTYVFSMQHKKKLYRHDLKTQSIDNSIERNELCVFFTSSFKTEVYSNRNQFNTAWISFCFSKFNQWKNTRQRTQPFVIYVCIILWFFAFLLMTSNPFLKTPFLCINSVTELNPVLQDPVLAIHPPCIYAGYVASAIGFSIALSYLRTHQPFFFVATATTSRTKTIRKHIQKKAEDILCLTAAGDEIEKKDILTEQKNDAFGKKHLSMQTLFHKAETWWTWFQVLFAERVRTIVLTKTERMFFNCSWPLNKKKEKTRSSYVLYTHLEASPFLVLPLFNFGGTQTKKSLNFQEQNSKWLLAEFTKQIRFWILTCWCFLTIGILLGSWWAYHELGWGGWWFWDPVENASLMPWLLATACIHSILSPKLQSWTFMLSIVTFMLSILGTFFVRSGLLASVHSFATDSTRGLFILCFLLCVFLLSITFFIRWLFFFNCKSCLKLRLKVPIQLQLGEKKRNLSKTTVLHVEEQNKKNAGVLSTKTAVTAVAATHKYKKEIEQVLQIQNVILCIICLVILCGTAAPILFQWLFQRDVSTGASFFNATTIPLFVTAILVMIYVHYAQLIYLKNSRSEKIALWEWSLFYNYPNCISQKAHPKQTAAVKQKKSTAAAFFCTFDCSYKTPLLGFWTKGKMRYHNFVSVLSKFVLLKRIGEYRVHVLDNYSSWISFFCSVFVFFSHVLILHYLTDFSYLESILAALCFVLCCYIVMSSTHKTFHVAVNSKEISKAVLYSVLLRKKLKDRFFLLRKNNKLVKKTRSKFLSSVYSKLQFVVTNFCSYWMLNKLENKTPNLLRLVFGLHTSLFMKRSLSNCSRNTQDSCFLQKQLQLSSCKKMEKEPLQFFFSKHQILLILLCNKSGTWSFCNKADNIAITKTTAVLPSVVFLNNRVDKTQFYSNAVISSNTNVLSEMKHKSFLTTASRLIMLIDKNPFRRIAFNMRLSHIGVLVFLIGVIVSNRKKIQLVQIMRFGQQMQLDNSICSLRSIDQNYGPTYHSICGNIIIQPQTYKHVTSVFADLFLGLNNWFCFPYDKKHSKQKALCFPTYSCEQKKTNSCVVTGGVLSKPHICMFPEKRFFFSSVFKLQLETLSTTKVAIYTNLFTDFYALIGTGSAETGWYTTIMQLPFIFCIWIGFLLAACGGLYSLRLLMKTSYLKWK